MILSTAYLPPVQYLSEIYNSNDEELVIEQHEHFVKQSYRNRCYILSANGSLPLTIPILHGRAERAAIKDIRISYDFNWQKVHWKSIESAYRCSPFFEYYEDLFAPFYEKRHTHLFDLNQQLMAVIFKVLKINNPVSLTTEYETEYPGVKDLRSSIHPKINSGFKTKEYTQVFSNKLGFAPNLCVLDLLFNNGPSSGEILRDSFYHGDTESIKLH